MIKRVRVSDGVYSDLERKNDQSEEMIDDFDSEENNHIYNSLQ